MNRLRQMSIFAHVVEQKSLSAAAQKLDLSKSVVSQHLKSLEQDLGVILIKRTTRRQTLTPVGEQFYLSCKNLNSIASDAWAQAQQHNQQIQGKLRITAPNALMETIITPVIAQLLKQYPKLQPELISDDQHLDIMRHNIDLAIRVGSSADSNIKQKRIGQFRDILCAHQDLVSDDINTLPYIANAWQGKQITHIFTTQDGDTEQLQAQVSCITNSFHNCLALINSGAGIGIIPDFCFQQLNNQLVNLRPNSQLPLNTVYALNPFTSATPIAVKVTTDAIASKLNSKK